MVQMSGDGSGVGSKSGGAIGAKELGDGLMRAVMSWDSVEIWEGLAQAAPGVCDWGRYWKSSRRIWIERDVP